MLCKNCGAEISGNQVFCPLCGAKNEAAMNQLPPYQPQSQVQSNQNYQNIRVPNQGIQGPMQGQAPQGYVQNQMQTGSIQGQAPQGYSQSQMQAGPMQGQAPQGYMQNQMQTGSIQGQMQQGYIPGQLPPGQMPSYNTSIQAAGKKKGPFPVFLVIGLVVLVLILIISAAIIILKIKSKADTINPPDVPRVTAAPTLGPQITAAPTQGAQGNNTDDITYDMKFSYTELPGVVSLDSDNRFLYYNYTSNEDGCTYIYQFNDSSATADEFYSDVDSYCSLLMTWNSYSYDEEFTSQMYDQTGEITDYFFKDSSYIGVTAKIEDTGSYVYVSIFSKGEEAAPETTGWEQYDYYLNGRDVTNISQYSAVYMENGLAFCLNDITVTDQGDGTAVISCNIDLGATVENSSIYSDDFLVFPYDNNGNVASDAVQMDNIYDSDGNELSSYVLDTEYFQNCTITFIVPSSTISFTFFGSNIIADDTTEKGITNAGPVYCLYIELE